MRALSQSVGLGCLLWMLGACAQNEFDPSPALPPPTIGPGAASWADDNVLCERDDQCGKFETCLEGVCQMKRCGDAVYRSAAPLGPTHYLATRRDLLVSYQGNSADAVAAYLPQSNSFVRPSGVNTQWGLDGVGVVDLAGGNLTGSRPESIVVVTDKSHELSVLNAGDKFKLPLGFQAVAVAAGDVTGDGLDEVVALGGNGEVSICNAKARTCERATFHHSWTGMDVAVGDVDGDGFAEPVFLVVEDGEERLIIWNTDFQGTAQNELIRTKTPDELSRITVGNLDAKDGAEVIGLHERSDPGNFLSDELFVMSLQNNTLVQTGFRSVHKRALDVAAGDLDGDRKAEVAVLDGDSMAEIYRGTGATDSANITLNPAYRSSLGGTSNVKRLALFDLNGDSPLSRLIEGPRMMPGKMVPIAVLAFPPFSRQYSEGIASVSLGNGSSSSNSVSESVSLGFGVSAGFGIPLTGLFGVGGSIGPSVSLSRDLSSSKSTSDGVSVGSSFSFGSRVERYGSEYAGIIVACGCFHAYTYQIEDPKRTVEGNVDGEEFTVFVPVGGQTALWSSRRYNAMAQALGNLPVVKVAHTIGQPRSYPDKIVGLEGENIPSEDMVFKEVPTFRTSDIGQVGWSLGADNSQTNGTSMGTTIGLSVALGIGPVSIGGSVSRNWSKGQSVTVGKSISFSGNVPGIPDDPATPEDEYEVNQFSFSPYVYRQHYTNAEGEPGAYYVLNYMVRN